MEINGKVLLALLSFISLFNSGTVSASIYPNMHASVLVGTGYTRVGDGQNVWLANTPEPGLENNFTSGGKQHSTDLLGFSLGKTFLLNLPDAEGALGLEVDYLKNDSLKGIVHPMVNVAPDFDTLNYSYRMEVYTLFATAKVSKLNLLPGFGAYLEGGVGAAINQLSDYTETSPVGSSAAPMLAPFGDESQSSFAYFIGIGLSFRISESAKFLVGYRYINSGSADFAPSPVQQTANTPDFSLSHHVVVFSLLV